ncbi:MAG: ABC transporter substrate-binding protein [Chloroflexi bacterium]|nr:ABC transporter substrate-binding protein [Chloroflexota bacterium]
MRREGPMRVGGLVGVCLALAALLLAGCTGGDGAPDGGPGGGTPEPTPTAQTGTPGVYEDRILFGQSAAFNGPAQELGKNMRIGIEAAFFEANIAGGVHGRILELTSLDDSYEPEAAIANTRRLIEEENVFALIGAVGTPTSRSATPIAAEAGVPYIAPFTGAAFLRDPEWRNIINLRASYNQETEEMVARLIGDLGIERIGIMYQDDSYGRAGYRGSLAALERRGLEPVAVGLYPRNTTAVKTALLDLREGSPDAVIMIGAYEPMAALIKWGRTTGFNPVFLNVSFVGSNALARELGPDGAGVVVTQVVPFPDDDSLPVIAAYKRALRLSSPDAVPGFVSLEGYLAGRLAIAGLESCGRDVDRACFVDALLGADAIDLEGFGLSFGEGDNQGSDAVFITVIGADGSYHPIENLQDVETWSNN